MLRLPVWRHWRARLSCGSPWRGDSFSKKTPSNSAPRLNIILSFFKLKSKFETLVISHPRYYKYSSWEHHHFRQHSKFFVLLIATPSVMALKPPSCHHRSPASRTSPLIRAVLFRLGSTFTSLVVFDTVYPLHHEFSTSD